MPKPDAGGTWGVLGGTYDPVHNGHLSLADGICRKKQLTGVLFIPAYRHPFKEDDQHAPYSDRVAMLRLAVAERDDFLVNEIEASEGLSGYTLDTLRALRKTYPRTSFRFIIGADNLDQIDRWYKPLELLAGTTVLAGARPGYDLRLQGRLPEGSVELVEVETEDISSTGLRRGIREGASDEDLLRYLPAKVLEYIRREKLYV
jgi:nicotinate-nucleotide adenylyltransferase